MNPKTASGSIDVLALQWKTWLAIARPERIDFMKIDIEGGELTLLPAMYDYLAEHRPTLYLSTHLPFIPAESRAAYVRTISGILQLYPKCWNKDLQPIDPASLSSEAALAGFHSVVLSRGEG